MSNGLDFNRANDFARATGGLQSAGSGLLQLFGFDPSQWDIEEASFRGARFHVFKSKTNWQGALATTTDEGGRRKAKYAFPYKDGQTTDDLGRKGETIVVDTLIHGPRYKDGLQAFLDAVQDPTPADLVHPVRGVLQCVCESFRLVHSSENRQAVRIEATFIEHNFTFSDFGRLADDNNFKSILTAAVKALAVAEQIVNKVQAAQSFVATVRASLAAFVAAFNDAFGKSLTDINTRLTRKGSNTDLPSVKPVNEGGNRNPDGTQARSTFPNEVSPNDPFAQASLPVNASGTAVRSLTNAPAAAALSIQNSVIAARDAAEAAILALSSADPALGALPADRREGPGALLFFDDIQAIRQSVILLQDAFERGVASSRASVVSYTTPRLMSVREVAFANGVSPERSEEIALLNPELLSVNYIPQGTMVQVPK
jgi:prophage DNA circulation protein